MLSALLASSTDNYGVGKIYIIFGSSSLKPQTSLALSELDDSQGIVITGFESYALLGNSLAGVGDINGDGYADIAIGCVGSNNFAGVVYVVYGSSSPFSFSLDDLASLHAGITISGMFSGFNPYKSFSFPQVAVRMIM